MRALEPADRRRIGLMAITVALLAILVGQSFTSVPVLFAQPSYYAQFTDTGGLNKNNPVRIAGMDVGNIQGITIDGDHIKIKFTTGHNTIGTETRLAIRTDTILGKKVLEVEPRGTQTLRPGATLPVGAKHDPVPDLRRVLRCHQGRLRLGHRHRQAVAACVGPDRRPDLPAPKRRPRRRR